MAANSLRDLFVEELHMDDKRLVRALPEMGKAEGSGDLETACLTRPEETRGQVRRRQRMVRPASRARAVLAGALGGLAGTLAMNYAQRLWTRVVDGMPPQSAGGKHDAREWQEREEGQNSNELVAQAVATTIAGRRLTRDELTIAAPLVHYSFGAAIGAIYGSLIHANREDPWRRGSTFGAAVWLMADEVAMPLLRLSRPTTERSPEKHLQSFVAHIVFGVVSEAVRARAIAVRS